MCSSRMTKQCVRRSCGCVFLNICCICKQYSKENRRRCPSGPVTKNTAKYSCTAYIVCEGEDFSKNWSNKFVRNFIGRMTNISACIDDKWSKCFIVQKEVQPCFSEFRALELARIPLFVFCNSFDGFGRNCSETNII